MAVGIKSNLYAGMPIQSIECGNHAYLPLSFLVLFISVLLGWSKLWDVGGSGWWMDALLCLGIIVIMSVMVALLYPWTSNSRGDS